MCKKLYLSKAHSCGFNLSDALHHCYFEIMRTFSARTDLEYVPYASCGWILDFTFYLHPKCKC